MPKIEEKYMKQWSTGLHAANPEQAKQLVELVAELRHELVEREIQLLGKKAGATMTVAQHEWDDVQDALANAKDEIQKLRALPNTLDQVLGALAEEALDPNCSATTTLERIRDIVGARR